MSDDATSDGEPHAPGEHLTYPEVHAVWALAHLFYDVVIWPCPFAAAEMWRP